jgi:hypothetical protein
MCGKEGVAEAAKAAQECSQQEERHKRQQHF